MRPDRRSDRVAEKGFWSPVGLMTKFFECNKDALGGYQCLSGTASKDGSEAAIVNNCSKVRGGLS
jgi:hypothetical protein